MNSHKLECNQRKMRRCRIDNPPEQFAFPTVMAIIERTRNGKAEILVQVRRDDDSRYDNTLELPTGKIRAGENPFDALKREVLEETGLKVIEILDSLSSSIYNPTYDPSSAFIPFFCSWQKIDKRSWCGFVFRCRVDEKDIPISHNKEVKKIEWMPKEVLQIIFEKEAEKINSFNLGILELYFKRIR